MRLGNLMNVVAMLVLGIFLTTGCALLESFVAPEAKVDRSLEQEFGPYSGPRARLAVAKFDWKVNQKSRSIKIKGLGKTIEFSQEEQNNMGGLKDMLTTALVQTKRYRVLERAELSSIMEEQALGASGAVKKGTEAKRRQIRGADILVVAAVTGWEPGTSKKSGGLGGFIPGAKILAGIGGAFKKSSMAMDIRIIDSATSEVLAATNVSGVAKEAKLGVLAGTLIGGVPLGGGLSSYAKTPMEKAIRICIKEAVKYVVENTPQEYFKH